MNKKETEILIARIEKWYAQLPNNFVYDKIPFQAKFGWSKEKVLFRDRLTLDYKPIKAVSYTHLTLPTIYSV